MPTPLAPETIDAADVQHLNFSQTVSLLNEPNMCSGGAETIRQVLRHAPPLGPAHRILEVGSNTGFSTLELAVQTTAQVTGIDIEPNSVRLAVDKATALGLSNVDFRVGDGTAIAAEDGFFDLVFASNVTSFIPDPVRAVKEYYRVLQRFGTLAVAPIFYRTAPPATLLAAIGEAVGVEVPVRHLDHWVNLFGQGQRQPFWVQEYEYDELDDAAIDRYTQSVQDQPGNQSLDSAVAEAAGRRLAYFYRLFDENLRYARFAVMLFRKDDPTTFPVLHTTKEVSR